MGSDKNRESNSTSGERKSVAWAAEQGGRRPERSPPFCSHLHMDFSIPILYGVFFFFAKRTLVLKETPNSTKHLNKNENYNEILEMPFVFNL